MKRPRGWLRWLFVFSVLVAAGEYVALTWLAPHYVMRALEHATGGQLAAGKTAVVFPSTTVITDLRLIGNTPDASLTVQRILLRLRWVSLAKRTLWFDAVELEQPVLRLTRTPSGTLVWPAVPRPAWSAALEPGEPVQPPPAPLATPGWRIRVSSFRILNGTLIYLDEKLPVPFHGLVDHVSLDAGPVVVPVEQAPASFAARGELIGHGGQGAPLYCSGWVGVTTKDLEASCKLEPLALEALEPYYHGKSELRVYTTTLKSTSQWIARGNLLDTRIQVEVGHLSEGDLSIGGRTLIDIKKLLGANSSDARLTGEISLTGPLDAPRLWHATLLPGDDQVQQLVKRLLDRGVESIKIPIPGVKIRLSMVPSSKAMMSDIEAASKEVHEALEILAFPAEEPAPMLAEPAPPTAPLVAPEAAAPQAPVEPAPVPPAPPEPMLPSEPTPPAPPAPPTPPPNQP